jgi:hypothetical protein
MSLETIDKIPSDFWDALWCPVCGGRDFVHIPHARTFCDECYTHFTIEWNDRIGNGFVTANVEEAWCIVKDEDIDKLKRYTEALPDAEEFESRWTYSKDCGYVMTKAWGYEHGSWKARGPRDEVKRVETRGEARYRVERSSEELN